jgi:hypothetical protein
LRTGVHKFQGIQKDKHDLTIKVVKNKDWTSKLYETYVHQLKKALGQTCESSFNSLTASTSKSRENSGTLFLIFCEMAEDRAHFVRQKIKQCRTGCGAALP